MVKNLSNNDVLATQIRPCTNFWSRLKGLLGTSSLDEREACWIKDCNSIHTIGMKYPIDAYFVNKSGKVVAIQKNMKPFRVSPVFFGADSVVEFKAGERSCNIGDTLDIAHEQFKKKTAGMKGQATVEFAVTFIIFISLVLGLAEISRICYSWISLQFAVSEGGRQAMLGTTSGGSRELMVINTIRQKAAIMGLKVDQVSFYKLEPGPAGTVVRQQTADAGGEGEYLEVQAKTTLKPMVLSKVVIGWIGTSYQKLFNITARTVVKNEPFAS